MESLKGRHKITIAFNIKDAKSNNFIIKTDNNYPVRILCYNRKHSFYPIVALLDKNQEEELIVCESNGRIITDGPYNFLILIPK